MNKLKARLEKEAFKWPHLSRGAKAAISREVRDGISSHIELYDVQEGVGVPTVTRINATQPEYEAAIDLFKYALDIEDENMLRDEIAKVTRMGAIRPLGFYKVRRSDGFLLLRHPETNRVFAFLNLHPQHSRFAEQVIVPELINLQTGELKAFKSKTGVLVPLEMGHEFHDMGFIERGRPQTARLVWRRDRNGKPCDDFELHVAFKWEKFAVETHRWLGIDRGIYNLASYAVIDDDGRVLMDGNISGMELRFVQRQFERRAAKTQRRGKVVRGSKRMAWADEAVHVTANEIVKVSMEHDARVVMEDLSSFSAIGKKKRVIGRRRGGFNRLLGRKQYEKIRKVLEYKLRVFGLPYPVDVRAAGTSQTCPECGHWSAKNRIKIPTDDGFEMDKFKCVECGHAADADLNAARVIAMKAGWLTSLPKKPKRGADGKLVEKLRFESYLQQCAARRRGP
jgi:IS605 OrfB family transposase